MKGESEYRRGELGFPLATQKYSPQFLILTALPLPCSAPRKNLTRIYGRGEKFGEREGYGLGRGIADGEREKYTDKYRRQGKIGKNRARED